VAKSILLVEDNAKLAHLLKERLLKHGYDVSLESRGDKAVYRIIREKPDLVILDIMLPGMDGKQICHTVRSEYKGKILMLTALDDDQNEVTSLNLGADDYLTKPASSDVLKARIEALLRRPSLTEPIKAITFDSLSVDVAKKEVVFAGKRIDLSPTEFELLSLLTINHDTILSRDTITQALRGHDYDGIDRSIDIKISHFRKLFNDNDQKPQRIKTIHRKGYMLVSNTWKLP
jgi:two-component system response regulator RstA